MFFNNDDTIVAPGTSIGKGAISIIRLSGNDAIPIAENVFQGNSPLKDFISHKVYLGKIKADEIFFDRVIAILFRSPNSYMGEDLIEFHLHGGQVASEWLIEILIKNGARYAKPGEFTYRALINGKIDLIQAESINEIINASNRNSLISSFSRLDGKLSEKINNIRDNIINCYTNIEAILNFPEDNISVNSINVKDELAEIKDNITILIQSYEKNKPIINGVRIVIAGPKNAGKSSLFNCLIGENKAIVSNIPGTTRDVVEANININGLPITLYDTAGLGEINDELDYEGMKKSNERMVDADLILYIIDSSVDSNFSIDNIGFDKDKIIIIQNKIDLGIKTDLQDALKTSATNGDGVDELIAFIKNKFYTQNFEMPLIGNIRQKDLITNVKTHIDKAIELIEEYEELSAEELKSSIEYLDEILGNSKNINLFENIFSKFCIGK